MGARIIVVIQGDTWSLDCGSEEAVPISPKP